MIVFENPETMEVVEGGAKEQAARSLESLKEILAAGGATFADVVKTTVFISDMNDFAEINEVYASFFGENKHPYKLTAEVRLVMATAINQCIDFKDFDFETFPLLASVHLT